MIKNNNVATKVDLKKLENRINKRFDKKFLGLKGEIDQKLDDHFERTDKQIKDFYSKIFNLVDGVMGEMKTTREEIQILNARSQENREKLGCCA